ncbi:MAG: Gfo/Idh/MocA family protein [Planctomycetota bacterium]|jgi:predicted dehydrogenase
MSEGKLRTAILGLNEGGQLLLEAAGRVDCLQIEAVADKDPNLVERIGGEHGCTAFDDYRQLVMQNDLDCLLVAEAMHSCEEYVRVAMKKKFNVLKLPPGARDFEEAAEFVRLSEEQDIRFAIANRSRFAQSFRGLRKFLQEGRIEHVFLISAFCTPGDQEPPGWQDDPKLSGGGVLIHDCYHIIDQIVTSFGMPEQVYSLSTNKALDKQQRLYLTEDTAVVTMKFSGGCIGNLVASRRAGTGSAEEFLRLYGRDRTLTVNDERCVLSDGLGLEIEAVQSDGDKLGHMTELLENFAGSIMFRETNKLCSSARENLEDMAVVESAYLSARTGFPEEPGRILQMASPPVAEAPGD